MDETDCIVGWRHLDVFFYVPLKVCYNFNERLKKISSQGYNFRKKYKWYSKNSYYHNLICGVLLFPTHIVQMLIKIHGPYHGPCLYKLFINDSLISLYTYLLTSVIFQNVQTLIIYTRNEVNVQYIGLLLDRKF